MAVVVAQATGNFSAGATWVGGVKPASGDIAETGNYTVTIDENFTGTLRPTGSGNFVVATGGITITGDLVMQSTYTGGGLRCTHSSGEVTLTGTATGGAGSNAYGAFNFAAGTLNVGTATGGAGSSAYGAFNFAAGTLNVGTATGGAGSSAHGAFNNAAGTLNVGTATGGAGSSAYGAFNLAAGTLNVTTATGGAGSSAHGAFNNVGGTLICDLAIGNGFGPGGTTANLAAGVYGSASSGAVTRVKRAQFGDYGMAPIWGSVTLTDDATNSVRFQTVLGGTTKTLVDSGAAADFPAVGNVRSGTTYDLGAKTGTCAVPAASQVAVGVAVDDTVGTAVLTAAGARGALGMASANLDTQIGTLATAAALATVDGNVDAHLDDILSDTALIEEIKAITDALDVTAVTQVAANASGALTITRTLNFAATVSGLTIPADWEACYWTVKRSTDDPDADALVQILESNPGDADDGVQVLMGEAIEDESDGGLTVNQAAGTVTIALGNASTALLEDAVELVWDVKVHNADGKTQPGAGTATITTAVTRA